MYYTQDTHTNKPTCHYTHIAVAIGYDIIEGGLVEKPAHHR